MADTKEAALFAFLESLVETDPQRELLEAFRQASEPAVALAEVKKPKSNVA